jgi:hypothetical protein
VLVKYRETDKITEVSCMTEGNDGRTVRSMPSARFTLVVSVFAPSRNVFSFPLTN